MLCSKDVAPSDTSDDSVSEAGFAMFKGSTSKGWSSDVVSASNVVWLEVFV